MAAEAKREVTENKDVVVEIELERLRDFRNHPFHIRSDDEMKQLKESIRKYGIIHPLIVRPSRDGVYEIISGHRRKHAAKALGHRKAPVIIRHMDQDEAIIAMVDSNMRRDHIRPSEKALALKMKYEALCRMKKETRGTEEMPELKGKRSLEILGEMMGESPKHVQRYMKLTELVPEMSRRLDAGGIGFMPAFYLANLAPEEQRMMVDVIEFTQSTPSLCQAREIREISRNGKLTREILIQIMERVKASERDRIYFKNKQIRQFFPRDYDIETIRMKVIEILEDWKQDQDETSKTGRIQNE